MSNIDATQSETSQRLSVIAERIGIAVWQLQELESVCAKYLVLVTQLTDDMDPIKHKTVVDEALSRPFGGTLRKISDAKLFKQNLQDRFDALLKERNWLIHKSKRDCRYAVHGDAAALSFIERVHELSSRSMALMHEIGALTDQFARDNKLDIDFISQEAASMLQDWHAGNAT